MAYNLINRYIWFVNTLQRYGALTREQLNDLWLKASISDGNPIPRRTFYNYRMAIADLMHIDIECNPSTFEYFIAKDDTETEAQMHQWLLNSLSLSDMLNDSQAVAHRIILEDVPSAHLNLAPIIDALKEDKRIKFNYKSHKRITTTHDIVLEPYFVKIFKQLWYVIGLNVKDNRIKTYSLDRMSELNILNEQFKMPDDINPKDFFKYSFGITTNQGEPKHITLRADSTQANYLRALPLHHSQQEVVHDRYSIFHYHMRLTYDLKQELLSHGSAIEILSPPELKAEIINELKQTLKNYGE